MFFSENGKIIDRIEGMSGSVECMSSICKILGGFSPAKPSSSDAAGQVERFDGFRCLRDRWLKSGVRGVRLQRLVWWQMGSPSLCRCEVSTMRGKVVGSLKGRLLGSQVILTATHLRKRTRHSESGILETGITGRQLPTQIEG